MAEEDEDKKSPSTWQMVGLFALRITDSGLAPWALVALFSLGGMWVLTRRLDSKDTLTFLSKFGTLHGLAWLGWVAAFVEIPICKWAINRARNLRLNQMRELQDENEKAREQLKKLKQSELELNSSK
jgi:hypothetical protein